MPRYIDADMITNALGIFTDIVHGNPHFLSGIDSAREIVLNCPTADVVPVVRGEWINTGGHRGTQNACSICGGTRNGRADRTGWPDSAYCGYCGARMDAKEGARG